MHVSMDGWSNWILHRKFKYRVVQKKGTVLLSTSLAWSAVAGCSRAETFSQQIYSLFTSQLLSVYND